MTIFTTCMECKVQFRKKSIKSRENICLRCKQWRKDFLKSNAREVTERMEKSLIKIKDFEYMIEKVNEDYISSLVVENLEKIVDEKFKMFKKSLAIINTRLIRLEKKVDANAKKTR